MEVVTLIPTELNDGTPVSQKQLKGYLDQFAIRFGGCTCDGQVEEIWIDPKSGHRFDDTNVRVRVACEKSQLTDIREAVIQIGRELKQKVMYFEINYCDGIEILVID